MRSSVGILADSFNWTPLKLNHISVLWLDSSDTSTISHTVGAVAQWRDKSGNNFHAFQTNADLKPLWGNKLINNRNVIELGFGGVNTYLNVPGFTLALPFTIGVVCATTTSTTQARFFGSGNLGVGIAIARYDTAAIAGTSTGISVPGVWTTNTAKSIVAVFDTTNSVLSWQGENPGTSGSTGNTNFINTTPPIIGGMQGSVAFWQGSACEIFVCAGALNVTERSKLNSYFKTKWKIT